MAGRELSCCRRGKRNMRVSHWPSVPISRTGVLGNGLAFATSDENNAYLWTFIWPKGGTMSMGGYLEAPKKVYLLQDGTPIDFEFEGQRITFKNLPEKAPDKICGASVIVMEFDGAPKTLFASRYPQFHQGWDKPENYI